MSAQTIAKLRAHAAGTGPEADIAKQVLADMGAGPENEEIVDLDCPTDGSWHHAQLFTRVCAYLGVESFKYVKNPRMWMARGSRSMCEAAVRLFSSMKVKLDELHRGTTIGFMLGALKVPDNIQSKDAAPLSADELEAARSVLHIGTRNNPRRQLGK